MDTPACRAHLKTAPVARLASIRADRSPPSPHLVPFTFALVDADTIVTAVDHKPKVTTDLARLRNIAANPRVCVLADHYELDWSALWWVRADGEARILEPGDSRRAEALDALVARYPQYAGRRPEGPVVAVTVSGWSGWSAASAVDGDRSLHVRAAASRLPGDREGRRPAEDPAT